jgi:hypothetical protein
MARWSATLIGILGLILNLLLLGRAFRAHLLRLYKLFFVYVLFVTFLTPALMVIYWLEPVIYTRWYWPIQFVTLVLGYGILLEILNHVLAPYPGAEKFARAAGIVAFGFILCFAIAAPRIMPHWTAGTVIEFERDLRCVQAIFIFGLLAVIFYYAIPIGRNMKGMILGYGLYIFTSLMSLAVRAYAGTSFNRLWYVVQPLSFDASLAIWLGALWTYSPNPVPDPGIRLEQDYEELVSRTRNRIGGLWSHFGKTTRG